MPDKSNPHADLARQNKAIKLCDVLQGWSFTPSDLEWFNEAHWLSLSQAAGTHPPSAETQRLVKDMLRARREAEKKANG